MVMIGGIYLVTMPIFGLAVADVFFDWRRVDSLSIQPGIDRASVALEFLAMRSGWGRLRLVDKIRNSSVQPTGSWPLGRLPNVQDDRGSSLLAELEEKWLGRSDLHPPTAEVALLHDEWSLGVGWIHGFSIKHRTLEIKLSVSYNTNAFSFVLLY